MRRVRIVDSMVQRQRWKPGLKGRLSTDATRPADFII